MILRDLDGTLTGTPYSQVLPSVDILPPTCQMVPGFSINFPASVCPPGVKFHRFAFNKIYPVNMKYRDVMLSNIYGNITTPYKFKAATHKEGWMMLLVDGLEHKISFLGAAHVTNISYTGTFYQFD
ncbi:fibrocystin-L-like, partial [Octopus sinensis]|uniref:Fibrocystin-L-like n=1 Tax=Octopus sinensis TaxID=2607531 RepID=A0A7E6EIF8_9MOLL